MALKSEYMFYGKPNLILLEVLRVKMTTSTRLSKSICATYSHTSNVLKRLVNDDILERIPDGRQVFLKLTPKGKSIALKLKSIDEKVGVKF